MDTNILLSKLNALYWFKDSIQDTDVRIDFLRNLKGIAQELEFNGLEGDIINYLNELEGR